MTGLQPIPYKFYPASTDSYGRPDEYYGACDFSYHWKYLIPLMVLTFGVLFVALFEAWQARNLSTEFQETQYIFKALSAVMLVAFVGVPVLFLVQDNQDASSFIGSAIISVTCVSMLLFMFVPKYLFERSSSSGKATVKITGLQTPVSIIAEKPFQSDATTEDASGRNSQAGERILSDKTRLELLAEMARLKKELGEAPEQPTEGP
ncbi:MAG: hypothetical protein SGILL_007471 [Bacillariaceae sp.]